jgi:hypothetical protein
MNSGHGLFGERAQQRAPQVPFYLDEPHYYLFQETRKGSTCSGFELLGINRSFVVRIGRVKPSLCEIFRSPAISIAEKVSFAVLREKEGKLGIVYDGWDDGKVVEPSEVLELRAS